MIALLLALAPLQDDRIDELEAQVYRLEIRLKNAERAKRFLADELKLGKADALSAARRLQMTMTLDMQNAKLPDVLKEIEEHSGLAFKCDKGLDDEIISIKVTDIFLTGLLKLMLQPKQLTFGITKQGEVRIAKRDPAPADGADKPLDPGTLLDYLLAPRGEPTADDRRKIDSLVVRLDSDELEARDGAVAELQKMGDRSWRVLESLAWKGKAAEGTSRLKELRERMDTVRRHIEHEALERDVPALATLLGDPRAHERLRRILSGLPPFASGGFPKPGPGLGDYVRAWWVYARDGARWNAEKDAYEPR